MQITFTFHSEADLLIPIQHNHILQGFIYHHIDEQLAAFLHNQGYLVNNRSFKLFVFSRLLGSYKMDKESNTINFGHDFKLRVASPLAYFCQSLCECMLKQTSLQLDHTLIQAVEAEVTEPCAQQETILVTTQSPVCVYSTLLRPNGQKYTCYFQPGEKDFNTLVTNNLVKKYQAVYHQSLPQGEVVLSSASPKMTIVNYKDFTIKGYTGHFKLTGPIELLQMALDAGIGSKNSQGFGFIELSTRRY